MRKTRVVEQAIAQRHLPRILNLREWDRHNRFLVGAGLGRRRLRDRVRRDAKCQDDQDQARYTAGGSRGDRRQSEAATRGRHGQFTIH